MKKEIFFVIKFETWNRRTTEKIFHKKRIINFLIKKKAKKKKENIDVNIKK